MKSENPRSSTKRLVTKLLFAVVGMFAFGFALVPLYDVICDITGLNGKTSGRYSMAADSEPVPVSEREITVQFMAQNSAGMEWVFGPNEAQVKVHPGEVKVVSYRAKNPNDYVMTGQAIPSVAPNEAAQYLKKLECFCFAEQELQPGEEVNMAIRFFVDENIPEKITKLTLSYSLHDITDYEVAVEGIAAR
ncbi:MAG: cytochrome c oxidase assembly protein [Gammaproteobacteria bacterium]|nr:cytochrome c oxidase assembly protein [Gammaproteobacteria bacterium]MDP2139695.1 cytochrome c oxidase assembly protein [Gammaproteobacteria bacterium]MDP2348899.1 cytochrome c oxidase assembly protein [Gammaproteobacteria bacterium]